MVVVLVNGFLIGKRQCGGNGRRQKLNSFYQADNVCIWELSLVTKFVDIIMGIECYPRNWHMAQAIQYFVLQMPHK